jgi:hypothetical protein
MCLVPCIWDSQARGVQPTNDWLPGLPFILAPIVQIASTILHPEKHHPLLFICACSEHGLICHPRYRWMNRRSNI